MPKNFVPRGKDKNQRPKRQLMKASVHTREQMDDIFYILYELCDRKYSRMSQLLFVTPQTLRRWDTDGLPNPHWAFVMRWLISDLLRLERTKHGSRHRKNQQKLYARFYKLPNFNEALNKLSGVEQTDLSEASIYVRTLLYQQPNFTMPWHKIRLPANSNGYSEKVLRRALVDCGAVKETTGYGEDKTTVWTLPIGAQYLEENDDED